MCESLDTMWLNTFSAAAATAGPGQSVFQKIVGSVEPSKNFYFFSIRSKLENKVEYPQFLNSPINQPRNLTLVGFGMTHIRYECTHLNHEYIQLHYE